MDAFDTIFDEARTDAQTMGLSPRRNKGLAGDVKKTAVTLPAPTNSDPVKAGKKKVTYHTEPTVRAPSPSTNPRKRGLTAISATEPTGGAPSANNSEIARQADDATHKSIASADDDSQFAGGNHNDVAGVVTPIFEGQERLANHLKHALENNLNGVGHERIESQKKHADTVEILVSEWRMRQRWHRAEKALILQSKAICRGFCDGDKVKANALFDSIYGAYAYGQAVQEAEAIGKACRKKAPSTADVDVDAQIALVPFLPAIYRFAKDRENLEKDMCKRTRTLPAYEWAMAIKGLGESGFASIVGEAGDIGSYRTVSGLWKRMGLAVINGERQRRVSDAELAIVHGYSPSRRSVAWNVGNGLIGGMGNGYRPVIGEDIEDNESLTHYGRMFVQRCRYLVNRDAEKFSRGTSVKDGVLRESYSKHCASSAKRYVEKKFLRDLYAAWRRETIGEVVDPEIAWRDRVAAE